MSSEHFIQCSINIGRRHFNIKLEFIHFKININDDQMLEVYPLISTVLFP